eukprot:13275976-Ditylum_brightwellii.AAC.1
MDACGNKYAMLNIMIFIVTLWSSASEQSTRDVVDFTYATYVERSLERAGKWKLTLSMKIMENGQHGTNTATTVTTRDIGLKCR